MLFKLKVKCTTPVPKLRLKFKNKIFGSYAKSILKSKSKFGKIQKLKLKLNFIPTQHYYPDRQKTCCVLPTAVST